MSSVQKKALGLQKYLRADNLTLSLVRRRKNPDTGKMETAEGLHFLVDASTSTFFVPIEEGMNFGFVVYNGTKKMLALPVFTEVGGVKRNIWLDSDALQPSVCSSEHMWELPPFNQIIIDGYVDLSSGGCLKPFDMVSLGVSSSPILNSRGDIRLQEAVLGKIQIYYRFPVAGDKTGFSAEPVQTQGRVAKGLSSERAVVDLVQGGCQYEKNAFAPVQGGFNLIRRSEVLDWVLRSGGTASPWSFEL